MGVSHGQLVDGALVLAQLMSPNIEIAQAFTRVASIEGDERTKVTVIIHWLNEGLTSNRWPSS
jgi:hypothetical protein